MYISFLLKNAVCAAAVVLSACELRYVGPKKGRPMWSSRESKSIQIVQNPRQRAEIGDSPQTKAMGGVSVDGGHVPGSSCSVVVTS